MSLVICSNLESDANITSRESSIYKPYSFRNALSSTMTIPKNAQVALQSCKINLDGTITIGEDSRIFYQYIGPYLDGTPGNTLQDTTNSPIRCDLFNTSKGVKQVQVEQLAAELQKSINRGLVHPLYALNAEVSVVRDADQKFTGFSYKYPQELGVTDVKPQMISSWLKSVRDGGTTNYTYDQATGTLTTTAHTATKRAQANITGLNTVLSPASGELIFDCAGSVNIDGGAQNKAPGFAVGLSCGSNTPFGKRNFQPQNYRWNRGGDYNKGGVGNNLTLSSLVKNMFEVCVFVGGDGRLFIFHTPVRSNVADGPISTRRYKKNPTITELKYYEAGNTGGAFNGLGANYNMLTNTQKLQKFKFVLNGEAVIINAIQEDGTEITLVNYDATKDKEYNVKAMGQNTYGAQPFMAIQVNAVSFNHSLIIEKCERCDNLPLFDWTKPGVDKCGWLQQLEYDGRFAVIQELCAREWNDYGVGTGAPNSYTYATIDAAAPNTLNKLKPVLILQESSNYGGSNGANCASLLGFDSTPAVDEGWTDPSPPTDAFYTINSRTIPKLLSTKSIFVRLENFTQTAMNARQGNRSSIIAHLPRFDGQEETGRLFFEPKNMIYLDLNNAEPLHVNSFDVSFVYSNEQYAESIVGQSIVVLHFKEKRVV